MRILLVSGNRLRGMGGTAYEAQLLLKTLMHAGIEVAILAEPEASGLPGATRHLVWSVPPGQDAWVQAGKAFESFQPDVVHVIGGGTRTMTAIHRASAAVSPRIPWCVTIHNVAPQEQAIEGFYGPRYYPIRNLRKLPQTLLWRRILRRYNFDVAICHSEQVVGLAKAAGCPPGKIRVVPLTLMAFPDLPEASMSHGSSEDADWKSPTLVTVGGFDFRKGQHDLVEATAILRDAFPEIQLVLIGNPQSPRFKAWLEQRIRSHNLTESVKMLMGADNETKFRHLADASVYVQASHEEGFCLAMLEAAMLSPRLVGTRVGAVAEMVATDPAGCSVNAGEPEKLAQAIEKVLTTQTKASALLERREKLKAQFGSDAYRDGHLRLYRDVMASSKRRKT